MLPHYKMASTDITNLYTNMPMDETLTIIRNSIIKTNTLNKAGINEAMQLIKIIINQNYFSFNGKYYMQKDGLAMGLPLSGVFAELYLNHFEQFQTLTIGVTKLNCTYTMLMTCFCFSMEIADN